jgi:imidazolonepropionase-like amidohydrolase
MLATLLLTTVLAAASARSPTTADDWLITGVSVIPADTDEVWPQRDVRIRAGQIASIVPAAPRPRAHGATIIDGRGKFLVPGFVDAHVHIATEAAIHARRDPVLARLPFPADRSYERQILLSFLKAGVTGAAHLGGNAAGDVALLQLRDDIAAGRLAGPQLFVGKRIDGPAGHVSDAPEKSPPASTPDAPTTPADGAAAVREAARRGYDFIKPYQFLDRETYRAVVDTAQELHLPTTGHLPELGCAVCADRAFAFAHPMTNIAHAEELARYAQSSDLSAADVDALAEAVVRARSGVTPTLITLKTIVQLYRERQVPAVPAGWENLVDPLLRRDWQLPRNRYLSVEFRAQPGMERLPAAYDFARVLTRALWKRGVPLTTGTDAVMPGLIYGAALQQEMRELRAIGMSPLEVLRAASLNARHLFAASAGSGAVRRGQRADLVLLDADPLADIDNAARIAGVFVAGRWLPITRIDAELTDLAARNAALEPALRAADGAR